MIIAINTKGICTAYKRQDLTFLCLINETHLEDIKSIFYNQYNDSLIVVRIFWNEDDINNNPQNYRYNRALGSLNIRSIPINYIETKQPHLGQSILNSERIKNPGFLEFDSANGCILTYNYYDPNDDSSSNNANHQLSQIICIVVCFFIFIFQCCRNESWLPLYTFEKMIFQ